MANNLFERALQAEGVRRAAATAAQAALAAAGTARRNADAAQALAARALLAAEDTLAALRREQAATPAAAAALAQALRQATLAQRAALAQQLTRAAEADAAAVNEAAARRTALAADTAWHSAQAALAQARAAHEARRAIIDVALTTPPLATMVADATALRVSQAHTDAAARIADALPAALRTRAQARAGQARALALTAAAAQRAAQAEVDAQAEAFAQPASRVPRLQRALQQADAALAAYAGSAAGQLAGAGATLADLAARTKPLLSAAQRAQLQDLQGGARPAAAAAEGAADDARLAIATAAATLRGERLRALVREPGGNLAAMEADAATYPELARAREGFDDATNDAAAPLGAYTGAMEATLAAWQAEVPEAVWPEAAALWAAEDTLDALKVAPAGLVAAVVAAEAALLQALDDDDPVQQRAADAAAALQRQDELQAAGRAAAGRLASAALSGPLVSTPWLQL